jgi:plasmid stabilization system protein ParE
VPRGSRFLPSARREFDAAHDWYLERSLRAAERFAVEVERVASWAQDHPDAGRIVRVRRDGAAIRVLPCRGYPYVVAWCVVEDVCVVLAVAHTRRRPGYWLYRAARAS